MSSIARFMERRKREEGVSFERSHCGRASIYRFPNTFEETAEAAKCLAKIDMDVLPFAGSISPDRRCHDGLGSQANRGRSAKTDWAWHDRILAVESKFASAVPAVIPTSFSTSFTPPYRSKSEAVAGLLSLDWSVSVSVSAGFSSTKFSVAVVMCNLLLKFLLVMLSGIQPASICCRIG